MSFDTQRALDALKQKQRDEMAGLDIDAAVAAYRGESVDVAEETLGADFNPTAVAPTGLRFNLSRGDTLEEKNLRLKKVYPDGEVKMFGRSVVLGNPDSALMYRETQNDQWKFVEPQGFLVERAKSEEKAGIMGWLLNREIDWGDFAEAFGPSAEAIVTEAAVLPITKGSGVFATVFKQALGAALGESVEQFGQTVGGTQAQDLTDILFEVGEEFAYSGGGGLAMSPVAASVNVLQGRGALRMAEEGTDLLQAANRLDPELEQLMTPGMVTDNPAVRLSERQAAALLPNLGRQYRAIAAKLDEIIAGRAPISARSTIVRDVVNSLSDMGNRFIDSLKAMNVSLTSAGENLQKGIQEYTLVSKRIVDDLYYSARNIEEPEFDYVNLLENINDIRAGAKGTLDPRLEPVLREIEATINSNAPVQLNRGTLSVTDQLRNSQTQLYALQNVPPGEVANQGTGQAGDIYKALKNTLNEPVNTNKGFIDAWSAANKAASERFDTLGQAVVVKAAKSETPAILARDFAKPYQVDNLRNLREVLPADRWKALQDSFQSNMLFDPAGITKTLDSFDPDTLDVLMSRSDQNLWRGIGTEIDRITSVGAEQLAETQITNIRFVDSLIEGAKPRDALTVIRAVRANGPEAMQSLRAGIIDWAWSGVLDAKGGVIKVNNSLFNSRIATLKKTAFWSALGKQGQEVLADVNTIAKSFSSLIDAGTSIQAAEAVSGIKPTNLQVGAVKTFVDNYIVSHLYLSRAGRSIFLGKGREHSTQRTLRLIGAALAQTGRPVDLSALEDEQGEVPRPGGFQQ